jgi:hypothetical protein
VNIYVSGSIQDIAYVRGTMSLVKARGHEITHDWTAYSGPKESAEEASLQLAGVFDAELLICVTHPRLKAGWMELGAAIAHDLPCVVVRHPGVKRSMWFELPAVSEVDRGDWRAFTRLIVNG